MGNLTRDVEVRQVGQSVVAKIDVAVGSSYTRRDGTQVNETEYFNNIEIWDKPNLHQYLLKGQPVLVQMVQKTEVYNDQQGQQRKSLKYRAQVVQLCGSPSQHQGTQQQPPMGPPQPQYQQHQAPMQQPPQQQYRQAPQPPMQPQYQQPQPPAQPQYQQPQPPAQPQYPQPGQPGNPQYPPMNSPAYTQPQDDDLPPGF